MFGMCGHAVMWLAVIAVIAVMGNVRLCFFLRHLTVKVMVRGGLFHVVFGVVIVVFTLVIDTHVPYRPYKYRVGNEAVSIKLV